MYLIILLYRIVAFDFFLANLPFEERYVNLLGLDNNTDFLVSLLYFVICYFIYLAKIMFIFLVQVHLVRNNLRLLDT